jgi:hypothetical protein
MDSSKHMEHKNVIIVGYPKSGTTWASSLVAELLDCPLRGDWGFDHITADFKEGQSRKSDYKCYKSHHTYLTIQAAASLPIHQIIYIIRDPRDIVISGVHYFNFLPRRLSFLRKSKWETLGKLARRLSAKFVSQNSKKQQMIDAVLYGNASVNEWLETNWSQHYKSYHNAGVTIIRYEDLLEHTEATCLSICKALGKEITQLHLGKSIQNQSFEHKKKQVVTEQHHYLNKLIRTGKSGNWKTEFSDEIVALFKKELSQSQEYYQF